MRSALALVDVVSLEHIGRLVSIHSVFSSRASTVLISCTAQEGRHTAWNGTQAFPRLDSMPVEQRSISGAPEELGKKRA